LKHFLTSEINRKEGKKGGQIRGKEKIKAENKRENG